jgi:hypothetical protein
VFSIKYIKSVATTAIKKKKKTISYEVKRTLHTQTKQNKKATKKSKIYIIRCLQHIVGEKKNSL